MPTALYVDRQQFKSITPKVGRPVYSPNANNKWKNSDDAIHKTMFYPIKIKRR